jgi:predicted phage terminase large subunit-like protein
MSAWLDEHFPGQRGHSILVEGAANGAAVIDVLRRELSSVIAIPPKGSKELRAEAVSPQVEAGNVHLPGFPAAEGGGFDRARTPRWVQEFVHEAESFPSGSHDDQVDAMAQALIRFNRPLPRFVAIRPPGPRRSSLLSRY